MKIFSTLNVTIWRIMTFLTFNGQKLLLDSTNTFTFRYLFMNYLHNENPYRFSY